MKRLLVLVTAVLFALVLPAEAQVQSSAIGPRVGVDLGDEIEEVFIGADARFSSTDFRLIFNPTFDYYFMDDPVTFWSVSANALYPFGVGDMNQSFTPYAGAGLGVFHFDAADTSTDMGVNLKFGAIIPGGTIAPFAEAQYSPIFADNSYNLFTIKGGLLIGF